MLQFVQSTLKSVDPCEYDNRVSCRCDGLSLRPASSSECPSNPDIGNCDSGGLSGGDLCESDGECGTNTELNNCGSDGYDIYVVVPSAGESPSAAW